jgi:cytochrome c oxidase cbb3-type subunit I/II
MEDPRLTSPGSVMPSYAFLLRDELDLSTLPRKIKVLRMLGTPYSDEEEAGAIAMAQAQAASIAAELERDGVTGMADREIVAMIAYLQRLGTDIRKGGAL